MPMMKPIKSDFNYSLKDRVLEWLWPIVMFYRQVCRSLAWAKFGWNNYDWDHAYLLSTMIFKMKRMQKAIFEEGHHIPDKPSTQSLKLCIKLGEKLLKDNYFYHGELHNKKWGELEFITKTDKEGRSYTEMGRSGVPKEKEEEERAEFIEACRKDDSIKARDTRWFFGIMAKYQESWWD